MLVRTVSESKILQIFYYAVMFQNCNIGKNFLLKETIIGKNQRWNLQNTICFSAKHKGRWEEPSCFSVKVMHRVSAKQMMSFAFPSRDTIATTYWIQKERFQRET